MARLQTGTNYRNQAALQSRDRMLGEALDDLGSQIAAVRAQGNFGQEGAPSAPHGISAIAVTAKNGFASVSLTHNSAPAGSRYVIEYSTTPNFLNPQRVDNGTSLTFERYLKGQQLYFRAAPTFLTSPLGSWIYFGGATRPTAVTF